MDHDIVFEVQNANTSQHQKIYAIKALLLYRTVEKEVNIFADSKDGSTQQPHQIAELIEDPSCPMFLRKVYFTQSGGSVKLDFAFDDNFGRNISALLRLLELLYCNQFVHMLTL